MIGVSFSTCPYRKLFWYIQYFRQFDLPALLKSLLPWGRGVGVIIITFCKLLPQTKCLKKNLSIQNELESDIGTIWKLRFSAFTDTNIVFQLILNAENFRIWENLMASDPLSPWLSTIWTRYIPDVMQKICRIPLVVIVQPNLLKENVRKDLDFSTRASLSFFYKSFDKKILTSSATHIQTIAVLKEVQHFFYLLIIQTLLDVWDYFLKEVV